MHTKINQIVYMAIEADYSYKFFENFEAAYNYSPQGFIAKVMHIDTHVSMKGYEHEILEITFLDQNQNTKTIIKRGWKISTISRGYWNQKSVFYIERLESQVDWSSINDCTFVDPKGELRTFSLPIYLSEGNGIFGPLKILKLLDILSKFDSWSDFDLSQKNKELSSEVSELKYDISRLKDSNEILRNQLKKHNITPES